MLTGSFLPQVGGMEYVIHYLASSLQNLANEVVVFCHTSQGRVIFTPAYEIVRYGFRLPFSGRLGLDRFSAVYQIRKHHSRKKFDVLHCHNSSYPGQIAMLVKEALHLPVVMTPHGHDVQRFPEINYGMRLQRGWEAIIRNNLSMSDAVTAISESIEQDINFLKPEKIHRIPNGVNVADFQGPSSCYLHDLLKINQNTKIILSVGRNHIKKGYSQGIRAFAESGLHRTAIAKYVIIGNGVELLQNEVAQARLQESVHLLQALSPKEIIQCYKSSYLFFSPSITEGLSMVSIEAMASGLPIVATDVPGNRDIVQENKCGMLVPANDITQMASTLSKLFEDQTLRDKYAENSLSRCRRYDWKNIAQDYLTVYTKVVSEKR